MDLALIQIASNNNLIADKIYLNNHNYQDHFFSAYMESKTIILHVHTKENIIKPMKKHGQDLGPDRINHVNDVTNAPNFDHPLLFESNPIVTTNQPMFHGHPIDI
jgi:hypothetical protein